MRYLGKLAVAAALGVAVGVYVGQGMSNEQAGPVAAAASASPVAEGAAYLPSQVINRAKEIEPLPPTF